MEYLLILLLCTLTVGKVIVHSAFGKRCVHTLTDAALFYGLVFLVPSLLFGYSIFNASGLTWAIAAVFGVLSAVFQLFYTKALAAGPVSLVGLVTNLAILLPVTASAVIYREPLGLFRILGLALLLFAFFTVANLRAPRKKQGGWLGYAAIAMLASGCANIAQKIFGKTEVSGESVAFVTCAYLVGAVVCFGFYLVRRAVGIRTSYSIGLRPIASAAAVGLLLTFFQVANTYAVATIAGTILFPAYSGGNIVFTTLAGVLVFHDRLSRRSLAGILLGLLAVVLVNL